MKNIKRRLKFLLLVIVAIIYFFSFTWIPRWILTGNTGLNKIGVMLERAYPGSDVDM